MRAERVLIVQNPNQSRGGEDVVVEAEVKLVRSHGQAVNDPT